MLHTGERWDVEQRDAYREEIDRAFATLSANPRIGRRRDGIASGLRSYQVRQHVIYYRVGTGTVTVVRILHGKMEAARHLDEP